MRPSAEPPIAAVTSVSDRRPKTARRVLEDVADKAGLSRNRAHLRRGLTRRDQCRAWASVIITRSDALVSRPVQRTGIISSLANLGGLYHQCVRHGPCLRKQYFTLASAGASSQLKRYTATKATAAPTIAQMILSQRPPICSNSSQRALFSWKISFFMVSSDSLNSPLLTDPSVKRVYLPSKMDNRARFRCVTTSQYQALLSVTDTTSGRTTTWPV